MDTGITRFVEVPGAAGLFLVIAHTGRPDGVALPLPPTHQQHIACRCDCRWCFDHPDQPPMWDTLRAAESCEAWRVHWPDLITASGGILSPP